MIFYRSKLLRILSAPFSGRQHSKRLPYFNQDFNCDRVFMVSALPGGAGEWAGKRRPRPRLGNTHPWRRYFNRPLKTRPHSLADIETFLIKCRYRSDRETRNRLDYWEPPDQFEARKVGDCEDHAIWAWRQLDDLGYRSRLVLGHWGCCHAWIHIFVNGRAYLLETTQKHRGFPDVGSYQPWWSVERIEGQSFAFFLHLEHRENLDNHQQKVSY
jgi:hypothetical protein